MEQKKLQNLLDSLDEGILGTRKQGDWDRISKNTKYSESQIFKEAKKYNTLGEFQIANISMYRASKRLGIFSQATSHMKKLIRHEGFTKKQVHEIALNFSNRWDFQKGDNPAYAWAKINKVLDEVCSHMELQRQYWDKEKVMKEALKYKNSTEFYKYNGSAYQWARKNKITKELIYKEKSK